MSQGSHTALSQAAQLLETAARLAGREWRLAKAEISENLGRAGIGLGLLAAAFILALVAAIVLAGAGVAGLVAAGFAIWLAALIVGGSLAFVTAILLGFGLRNLQSKRLIPNRTLSNIQRDMEMVKEAMNA
ncbi:phage holin family protein [Gymnodinialimonas sp. 2305UL16-5]|uniref:phage holin family protein n=1 Tax=Gymnodinialimonas mytili TaxID=3126503 RepID=UPI0030AB98A3